MFPSMAACCFYWSCPPVPHHHLGIGLLISTVANTQQEAMLTTMFTCCHRYFFRFHVSVGSYAHFPAVISYAIPLRYFLIIARGIVLKGTGAEVLIPEILALCLFALLVMAATALRIP
jgi:ABC-2 type transport system permease protein